VLPTTQGSATTNYLYGAARLASLSGSTRTWYAADGLSSVRRTLADTGTPLGVVNYDPWGTPRPNAVRCQPCAVILVRRQPNIPVRNFNVG